MSIEHPYSLSARYPDHDTSSQPYAEAQELIFHEPTLALSVFRLQFEGLEELGKDWYVAIIGEQPPAEHHHHFRRILQDGEPVELPRPVLDALFMRRAELSETGAWVEGHYAPPLRRRIVDTKKAGDEPAFL